MDRAGNLYGTASNGGNDSCDYGSGCGTVFRLSHSASGWLFTLVYAFQSEDDGWAIAGPVVFGSDGNLYGTTEFGGSGEYCNGSGCGTVYKLSPPAGVVGKWTKTMLYSFARGEDGAFPTGQVSFDSENTAYVTGAGGGAYNLGVVAKLTPSHGQWTETAIYAFNNNGGVEPWGGVVFDRSGNLYGTTLGYPGNEVFQLTPSGSDWLENTLYTFSGAEANPWGGLIFDPSGNLYGTTWYRGGTVFELTPSGDSWAYGLVYRFVLGHTQGYGPYGPAAGVVMDSSGNLYGTTESDGAYGFGSVFKLTPSENGWIYTALHDFSGGADGLYPVAGVTLDANGNLYGTAGGGGAYGYGVVWEITP
jgi:uncharacterized repeat protein (TIGR03803 family)